MAMMAAWTAWGEGGGARRGEGWKGKKVRGGGEMRSKKREEEGRGGGEEEREGEGNGRAGERKGK